MSTPCDINPARTLAAMRDCLVAEASAVTVTDTITLGRSIVWLLIAALGETVDDVDALAEEAAAADRLQQELAVARAEIGRLETRLATTEASDRCPMPLDPYHPMGKSRLERDFRRQERDFRRSGADIVDLSAILERERRAAGRSQPSDGGGRGMTVRLTEMRIAALMAARAGRLWKIGRCWRHRGTKGRAYDERTIGPMVTAGLLTDLHGSREITEAGRRRIAELEGRR